MMILVVVETAFIPSVARSDWFGFRSFAEAQAAGTGIDNRAIYQGEFR